MSGQREIKVIKREERPEKTREEHERDHQIVMMYFWMEKYYVKADAHMERLRAEKRREA